MTTTRATTPATRSAHPGTAGFAHARQVADAVLFEGYVLYPYRASAAKNRLRWQFGVLVPPAWGPAHGEHSTSRTELLMEPRGTDAVLAVELRFLHALRRTVQRVLPDGGFEDTAELHLPDRVLVPWDEGAEERVEFAVPVGDLLGDGHLQPFARRAREETEPVHDSAGRTVGRLVRRAAPVQGAVRLRATELDVPYRAFRLTATVENTSGWVPDGASEAADRDAALPRSLVAAHLLLGLSSGSFLSMTAPPEWARAAVAACENRHTWPVLAGAPGRADVVLSSPIILEDHPAIAPESAGAMYDATEIDEILALRTAALTEQEKREARGTDARAAAVVDLADSLPPEVLERLHGAVRSLRDVTGDDTGLTLPGDDGPRPLPSHGSPWPLPGHDGPLPGHDGPLPAPGPDAGRPPESADPDLFRPDTPWWDPAGAAPAGPPPDRVLVDGVLVGEGSRVLLRPGLRRTDAQDLFLAGRAALVESVLHDVDGVVHLAVTVEGDPGADIRREQGRFLYFQPDEVTPLPDAPGSGSPGEEA
ncbi:hypothetical protein [Streptomyces sp. NRRL S-87]|uniref:hypothetical protein n=1 Tax=Streptomyces sp. NRRL S-87 TaxID=1463920 RepID=UPI00068A1DCA|nr:hypothetical protein [Streptomyces sp. NRRL S-87]